MDTLTFLQHYWWFIISLLGALLVFLMFVQGGQALLYDIGRTEEERNMLVNSLGRKWEFTFTTLVTFGGAFFASFPLFYSTSFGGAFYVWMAILFCFVLQAVAYEYRRKPANVFGKRTFNAFLLINGVLGPLLIGTAVGTFFTGAEFTVDRLNLANQGGAAVISQWATPWHGLEAVAEWRNVLLGAAVALLAMTLACQYFMNNIDDETILRRAQSRMRLFGVLFVVCFVAWLLALLLANGRAADAAGTISVEPYKYLRNLLEMPYVTVVLLLGVVSVLWSIRLGWCGSRRAVWFGGAGTVLTVLSLLLLAGWNGTAYYPSLTDMQSSLTITNSSSSLFTLRTMAWVSLFVPFVAAYIWYAWRAMNRRPITREEIRGDDHQY
ncbi:cytochrome d ubiquinol oxidase subunit II [Alistipes senegalensis]|uniref:Cytochrome d ubiquinol oxidase subunit II n=1 Tax=Alistipes senegalensis JC50 TaxID=1033732 RepID=A0ABY5VAN8_9BACT|nr:cytochrome d ubiquinol oxidase subunit II [Alistipes senegalensis]UEA86509.1 cytochrome d ubiquinol oxidase subunit II [Alistipes senegalensis]UWN65902.1 cytochrome d ubiquinol oxidase subunit II [Alistipes senegalensis JC50]